MSPITKATEGRLVLVYWRDADGPAGTWVHTDKGSVDHLINEQLCRSVGWIHRVTRHSIFVIPHEAPGLDGVTLDQFQGEMVIPKRCIERWHVLEEPDEPET